MVRNPFLNTPIALSQSANFFFLFFYVRYGGAYQLGSSAFQPLTGKIFRYFSIKVCHSFSNTNRKHEL